MRALSLFSAALGVTSLVIAGPLVGRDETLMESCGAPPVTPEFITLSQQMLEEETAVENGTVISAAALEPILIDIWFHVVATGKTKSQGWVTVRSSLHSTSP